MEHSAYVEGKFDTNFIDSHWEAIIRNVKSEEEMAHLAAIAIAFHGEQENQGTGKILGNSKTLNHSSRWKLRRMNFKQKNK